MSLKVFGEATSAFGFPTSEKLAKELDVLLKENPDFEYFKCSGKVKYFEDDEKADVSVITDDSVDADKEVVELKSINLAPLQERGIVAWNHNYNIPPVGKSIWQKTVGNKVLAKTVYNVKPPDGLDITKWFPATVFHMIKSGFLPGKSIGGIAKRVAPTTEEVTANPGLKDVKFIRKNAVVYEYSVVTLNCNKNAIVEAVSKGLITTSPEILSDWPEVADIVKDIQLQKQVITIDSYRTIEQYQEDLKKSVAERVSQLNFDKMSENALARVLGRV